MESTRCSSWIELALRQLAMPAGSATRHTLSLHIYDPHLSSAAHCGLYCTLSHPLGAAARSAAGLVYFAYACCTVHPTPRPVFGWPSLLCITF